MKDKKCTINDVVKWYREKSNYPISSDLLTYMVSIGLVSAVINGVYSLLEINDVLLEKYNGEYVFDENGKYKVKENRKLIIDKHSVKKETNKKYKLTPMNGNKLKLIKIN